MLFLKNGSGIHIKKENEGKFTASAKRAGMNVQEYANKVLNDPNSTPLQRKRANFARNVSKWHPRKGQEGLQVPSIDMWTQFSRKINGNQQTIQKAQKMYGDLISRGMSPAQAIAITGIAGFETGGTYDPRIGKRYKGLLQWDRNRFPGYDYNTQIQYISDDSKNNKSWSPGVYYDTFHNTNSNLRDTVDTFEKGYVRSANGRKRAIVLNNIFGKFIDKINLDKLKFTPDGQ